MAPENDDFRVDLTFSGREKSYARPAGIIAAAVLIPFIAATMMTDMAAYLLPMDDRYLQVLVPAAADGTEALSLKFLAQQVQDRTMAVHGTVANRTDYPITDLVAVVEMQDTTGRFPQTVEAPVEPAELPAGAAGSFMAMATLQQKPAGYLVKFRLADGPLVPHKDERAPAVSIPGR